MSFDLRNPGADYAAFWAARHLCTVTTLRPDGTPHVVPMGIALDLEHGLAWGITSGTSRKAHNVAAAGPEGAPVAVCQVDGRWWATLEGRAVVHSEPDVVEEACRRYAARYKEPRPNPARVALRITLTRLLGNVPAETS